MTSSFLWTRQFLASPESALKSAEDGPVYIAKNGWATHVILNYEDYAAIIRIAHLPDLRMDQLMISFNDDEDNDQQAREA